mgnify:CR=1 FL=1
MKAVIVAEWVKEKGMRHFILTYPQSVTKYATHFNALNCCISTFGSSLSLFNVSFTTSWIVFALIITDWLFLYRKKVNIKYNATNIRPNRKRLVKIYFCKFILWINKGEINRYEDAKSNSNTPNPIVLACLLYTSPSPRD